MNTYWEKSVQSFFKIWKQQLTPMQNLKEYNERLHNADKNRQQEARKKFLEKCPVVMNSPAKKKRGRPKKKKAKTK